MGVPQSKDLNAVFPNKNGTSMNYPMASNRETALGISKLAGVTLIEVPEDLMTSKFTCRTPLNIGSQSGTGYIWLCYSIFFFIEPIHRRNTRFWLECAAIYAVFLALYVGYMYARTDVRRRLVLVGFYILALAVFPTNGGASSFFVYSAAFLPFAVVSAPALAGIMLAQCLGLLFEGLLLHIPLLAMAATVFLMLIVGTSNAFIARQKRMDRKLRDAREENVQLAALAERERIARDLHDVLGHTLSVIVLKAELARRLIEREPQRAAREIADVESTARTALAEVREAIGGYRAQGLVAELARARTTLDIAGVKVTWEPPASGLLTLSATEETVFSLAMREAVTNIVRHAEATRCTMLLTLTNDGYCALLVEDDGPHAIESEGSGLRGMRERVEGLGGRLSIRNERGTRLMIELPVTSRSLETPVGGKLTEAEQKLEVIV